MKKFDYYAANEPWKMPKWLGATLGGIFSVVAVGAAVLIVQLTRPAHADAPSVKMLESAAVAPVSAPARVETPPPAAPPLVAATSGHAKIKHLKASHHTKVARAPISKDRASAILAKHDSREKRKAKDDLDRLLGL